LPLGNSSASSRLSISERFLKPLPGVHAASTSAAGGSSPLPRRAMGLPAVPGASLQEELTSGLSALEAAGRGGSAPPEEPLLSGCCSAVLASDTAARGSARGRLTALPARCCC
jgi:hypothetical protein